MMTRQAPIRWRYFKTPQRGTEWRRVVQAAAFVFALVAPPGWAVDRDVRQLIVSIADDWNSRSGRMQCFERASAGWKPASPPVPVLFGSKGLAWGRGVEGTNEAGLRKTERDGRA